MIETPLELKWAQEFAEQAEAEAKEVATRVAAELAAKKEHQEQVRNIKDHLPKPTGWRVVVLPYRGVGETKGGILLPGQTLDRQQLTTTCAYVLAVGPLAYADTGKFPHGPWCKEGDWIIFGRYAGARMNIEGGEIRILNDDEILATINDPNDILHM